MRSPIEKKLANAIVRQAGVATNRVMIGLHYGCKPTAYVDSERLSEVCCDGSCNPVVSGDDHQSTDAELLIYADVLIDRYKVDLLVCCAGGDSHLAVECDGHDWHERTKQQASADRARDRALLRLGVPTIRFTGSDITYNADACAIDIIELSKLLEERSYLSGHMAGWRAGCEHERQVASKRASASRWLVNASAGLVL